VGIHTDCLTPLLGTCLSERLRDADVPRSFGDEHLGILDSVVVAVKVVSSRRTGRHCSDTLIRQLGALSQFESMVNSWLSQRCGSDEYEYRKSHSQLAV
jgi:hypothetical protein